MAEPACLPTTQSEKNAMQRRTTNKDVDKGVCVTAFGAGKRAGYASPDVSNIAESMASRADLPAQTTNWKAG
jgi:hypothetical protein